ncbi:MAG: hypothetical protein E7613_06645 [Ruminococcaceae bacterium]|nr:hypothetical protein [Oscillospiraceae bacterium]
MKLKVDFKSSGGRMKADFGAVMQLSPEQKREYESRIETLEKEKSLEYERGRKNEYDSFWDSYQDEGTLRNYSYAFSGRGWDDVSFDPKYDIITTNASHVFYYSQIGDLEAILKKNGVKLDTSRATTTDCMFSYSTVTVVPELDIRQSTDLSYMFYRALNLHTIRLLKLSEGGEQVFQSNTFLTCKALKNIRIDGFIGSDISFKYSPLTYDSIHDIVFHLSIDIEPGSKTAVFSEEAVNKAFESSPGANDGSTSDSWRDLRVARPMWIISCE